MKFTSNYIKFPPVKPTVLIGRQSDGSCEWESSHAVQMKWSPSNIVLLS